MDSESPAYIAELENLHLEEVAATAQQKGGEIKESTETLEEEKVDMPNVENCNTVSQGCNISVY